MTIKLVSPMPLLKVSNFECIDVDAFYQLILQKSFNVGMSNLQSLTLLSSSGESALFSTRMSGWGDKKSLL